MPTSTFEILNKGLSFIPTKRTNLNEINYQLQRNATNIDRYIQKQIINETNKQTNHKPISYQFTTNFINSISKNINHLIAPIKSNLSRAEQINLKQIINNKSIIIKPVDKNLGTAIINTNSYIELTMKQHLNDNNIYEQLNYNPLQSTTEKITNIIHKEHRKRNINTTILKKLLPPSSPRLGHFYILPKLHKKKLQSRPIISNINHPTSNISKYLHKIMQPTVINTQTYINNSYHLTQMLKTIKSDKNTILITADIESLYTNIPHKEGIDIVTNELYKQTNKLKPQIHKESFKLLLKTTLKNNIFTFHEEYFLQKHGTAMGTIMAPSYANIYLKHYEDKWLNECKYKHKILLFVRYIDDILIILNNNDNNLDELLEDLKNNIYQSLKLEIQHSNNECNFLDITIMNKYKTQQLTTKLFSKPLDSHQYLHQTSDHPNHIISNLSYGMITRIQRLCTSYSDKRLECNKLLNLLLKQQHDYKIIKNNIKKLITTTYQTNQKQQQSTKTTPTQDKPIYGPTIRLTYSNDIKPLIQHINTRWTSATLIKPQPLPRIVHKTNKTLKQMLVHSTITKPHNPITITENIKSSHYKTTQCSRTCQLCKYRDTQIQEQYNNLPQTFINCNAKNIVYNIKCQKCKKEYIGESKYNARTRIKQHLKDIQRHRNTIISNHFNKSNHYTNTDFKFNILVSTTMNTKNRKQIETTIIHNKRTLKPHGLNQKYSYK